MQFIILGAAIGLGVMAAGAKVKNVTEDKLTESQDSFTRWDKLFKQYGADQWMLLKAVAMNESRLGDEESVAQGMAHPEDTEGSKSSDGKSWGLMQITIPTGQDFDPNVSPRLLNNPEYSIRMAARLVRQLSREFQGIQEYIVKAYNQGTGNMRKELNGEIDGYAEEYWNRFQRNYKIVVDSQGGSSVG